MTAIAIRLTEHAIERYHERVRPSLEVDQARREARWVLDYANVTPLRPDWWYEAPRGENELVAYAMVGDGIAFGLALRGAKYYAITCCTRGGMGASARAARNHERQHRQNARAARRQKWRERKEAKRLRRDAA